MLELLDCQAAVNKSIKGVLHLLDCRNAYFIMLRTVKFYKRLHFIRTHAVMQNLYYFVNCPVSARMLR